MGKFLAAVSRTLVGTEQDVYFSKVNMAHDVVHHHAVKVGQTWFEVAGGDSKGNMIIVETSGDSSKCGVTLAGAQYLGRTTRSSSEIEDWKKTWLTERPQYGFLTSNCQMFARDFVKFLGFVEVLNDEDDRLNAVRAAAQIAKARIGAPDGKAPAILERSSEMLVAAKPEDIDRAMEVAQR